MINFLQTILDRQEQLGNFFASSAYQSISTPVIQLLNIMLVIYVSYYGVQLVTGTSRLSVSELVSRTVRMMIIITMVKNWDVFNAYLYNWLNTTPENIGRDLLTYTGTGIYDPVQILSDLWKIANQTAGAFTIQSGAASFLPALVSIVVIICALAFVATALGLLMLSKLMLWVLVATAPVFIACFLFEQSRGYGAAWFRQVLAYALIPMFLYVVCAFLIYAIRPELQNLTAATQAQKLNLRTLAGFLLICMAGTFVLLNIRTLAQNIASGTITIISQTIRQTSHGAMIFPVQAGSGGMQTSPYYSARQAVPAGTGYSGHGATRSAIQRQISNHSMPR